MSSTDAQLSATAAGLRRLGTEKAVVDDVLKTAMDCMLADSESSGKTKDESNNIKEPPKGMELMLLETIREFLKYTGYDVAAEALRIEAQMPAGQSISSLRQMRKVTGLEDYTLPVLYGLLAKTEAEETSEEHEGNV